MKPIAAIAEKITQSLSAHSIHAVMINVLIMIALGLPGLAATDWQTFTPRDFEFSILMPHPVETEEVHKGTLTASVFKSKEDGSVYTISVLDLKRRPNFEKYFKEVLTGLKEKGSVATAISNIKGSGWKGKCCALSKDGEQVGLCLVALGEGTSVVYTLNVRSPSSPSDAEQFFKSFMVYPDEAVEAHGKPAPGFFDKTFQAGLVIGLLAGIALMTIVWLSTNFMRKKK